MAVTKRHVGFGKWVVEADGKRLFGPATRDAAEARVLALAEPARPKGDGNREYLEKMYADLAIPIGEEMAAIKAVLAERRDEDEVAILMRHIEPILKAGKQAFRRERMRFVIAPGAAPAA